MKAVIVREAPRAERADVEALAQFGVATVREAQGRSGLLKPYLRPVYRGARASWGWTSTGCGRSWRRSASNTPTETRR